MLGVSYASPPIHGPDNGARLKRITEELEAGYKLLETINQAITVFGSARVRENDLHYEAARSFGRMVAEAGFTTVTGGGPGIMEAANRGATEVGGRSIGFNILLKEEQKNSYIQEGVSFYYLFVRKVMLASAGSAYVFFPGGFGTLDEFFEISTLIHIHKLHQDVPVVLIGKEYWEPLVDYLRDVVVERHHGFDALDFRMWTMVDTPEEALATIKSTISAARLHGPYHHE